MTLFLKDIYWESLFFNYIPFVYVVEIFPSLLRVEVLYALRRSLQISLISGYQIWASFWSTAIAVYPAGGLSPYISKLFIWRNKELILLTA